MKTESYIARIIYSRDGKERGTVKRMGARWCAGCGTNHACCRVQWGNGKVTLPCTAAIRENADGSLQIL